MSTLNDIRALLQIETEAAIPTELVDALIAADAEQKAAAVNAEALRRYMAAIRDFVLTVAQRPDLPLSAPIQPNRVVYTGVDSLNQPVYTETGEKLGIFTPDYVPKVEAKPVGVVAVGHAVLKTDGTRWYATLPSDTVEGGAVVTHPLTGEKLRKVMTPFGGGAYEVIK